MQDLLEYFFDLNNILYFFIYEGFVWCPVSLFSIYLMIWLSIIKYKNSWIQQYFKYVLAMPTLCDISININLSLEFWCFNMFLTFQSGFVT